VSEAQSDALVLFGATGDLAYPADFSRAVCHGPERPPEIPVIGVSRQAMTDDEFRARAKKSLVDQRPGDREGSAR
jgi:glucose-6-phosphate 1-dehydrogenase